MLREHALDPADIGSVKLSLPPYGHKLVGHEFRIGDNPTVDGQFSAQYCVANVLLRGSSRIRHFAAESVCDPAISKYVSMVSVVADPDLDRRSHTATDMTIRTRDGSVYERGLDIAPGFPGNPLTKDDHTRRFRDCIDFGRDWFSAERADKVLAFIEYMESASDVRDLICLLTQECRAAAPARTGATA
jgi:2-methylcitrate dehydratase PrpD